MQQLVKVPTRANRTLDVFITKCPFLWKPGSSMKGLVRSDHLAIIVYPSTPEKPIRKKVSFRDTREHCKIAMDLRLEGYDWSILSSLAIARNSEPDKLRTIDSLSIKNFVFLAFDWSINFENHCRFNMATRDRPSVGFSCFGTRFLQQMPRFLSRLPCR